jgi:hypothetical protein
VRQFSRGKPSPKPPGNVGHGSKSALSPFHLERPYRQTAALVRLPEGILCFIPKQVRERPTTRHRAVSAQETAF